MPTPDALKLINAQLDDVKKNLDNMLNEITLAKRAGISVKALEDQYNGLKTQYDLLKSVYGK